MVMNLVVCSLALCPVSSAKVSSRRLFLDVYTWAGSSRTVRTASGGNPLPARLVNERLLYVAASGWNFAVKCRRAGGCQTIL